MIGQLVMNASFPAPGRSTSRDIIPLQVIKGKKSRNLFKILHREYNTSISVCRVQDKHRMRILWRIQIQITLMSSETKEVGVLEFLWKTSWVLGPMASWRSHLGELYLMKEGRSNDLVVEEVGSLYGEPLMDDSIMANSFSIGTNSISKSLSKS